MAITETTPRKRLSSFLSFSKAPSSISSFSSHLPPPTPLLKFSESMMEENIEIAEIMITKWGTSNSSFDKFDSLLRQNRREAKEFIKCVKGLRRAMDYLVAEHSTSSKLVQAQHLMQTAMRRLQLEFYLMLSANNEHLKPESVSSRSSCLSRRSQSIDSENEAENGTDDEIQMVGEAISDIEQLTLLAMSDLRLIAESMISSGYSKECVKIYIIIRKSTVDESLYRLGIEQYSSQLNRMTSDALEPHIKNWLKAVNIAVKTLFYGERFLCDHVFSISQTIRETCFAGIAKDGAIALFRFPELVARSKRSPDKVFWLLDLYEAIQELWPDIESIFSYESVSAVKLQALSSLQKLGNSVQLTLSEFETTIQKDSSKAPVLGGIHPLTNRVLDYTSSLANYSETLSRIATDSSPPEKFPLPESYFQVPNSAISVRLAWIILVLLCKLDRKAEFYNDVALSYLFLANNLQFILENVRATALKHLLGGDWVAKLDRKVKSYSANYERMAWTKVLSCLLNNSLAEISPETVKMHFKKFSAAFEEAYRKQMSWVVPDGKLRDEIKYSIARKLVPAYQEFFDKHFSTLSGEKDLEVLVRFSPDNLGNYLSDLFHGSPVSWSSSASASRARRCLL